MQDTPELIWLAALAGITSAMWAPYVAESFVRRGILTTMGNPTPEDASMPAWADRARRAHRNAIENLAVFAPLVIAAVLLGGPGASVLLAVKIYVFARLAHYLVYVAGIPVVRTLAFLAGFLATVAIALSILAVPG